MSGAPDNKPLETPPATTQTPPATTTETPPATTETKPAETKLAETKPAEKPQPLTMESIKAPEGLTLDEALSGEFLGIMNNAELDPAKRSQALLDLYAKTAKAASEKSSKQWEELQNQWTEASKKEFGDKLEPNLGKIAKLIDAYAGDEKQRSEFRDLMDLQGAGNHPAVIRFLSAIADKLVVEGTPVSGTPGSQPRSHAEILFPNQGKAT